jgi:uncharacterized repeat protein (TIGR03803 family)
VLVFALATTVHAQTYSVVYNFGDVLKDGVGPQYSGIIAQGRDGVLYTTTPYGGENGVGTVVKITPAGQASVLYNFNITDTNEEYPFGGLTLGTDGNLYGTTLGELENGGGKVFKITPTGQLTFLHTFASGEGRQPFAPLIQAADGNFYGTTTIGGDHGYGTVYKLTPSGPIAPLIQGTDGNFYGTTFEGGEKGAGTVFRVNSKGKITTLHSFDWYSGAYPRAPLVQGSDGNLYGVADEGGDSGYGVIFKVSTKGKFKVLHSYSPSEGEYASAGLVQGTDGNFYGTNYGEPGTIYRITPRGKFLVLHTFDNTHGSHPEVTLLQHTTGILYGDTFNGGSHGYGTFYSLDAGLAAYAALVPTSAKVGKSIGILGQGFTGTTAVSFNGTSAQFNVTSDTFLTATVPDGATTGLVTVATPGGNLTSKQKFQVTPVIQSFTPASGPVGTTVTITGVSLTQATKVTFGGVAATSFTVDNDKQVTANVPTGAKTGKIVIGTPGGTATSRGSFTVTP